MIRIFKGRKRRNVNKKILESKRIIKEEKAKIRSEKRIIREKRLCKVLKIFFGKKFGETGDDRNYSFTKIFNFMLVSFIVGIVSCFSFVIIFCGGRNIFKISHDFSKLFDVYETLINNNYSDIDKEKLVEDAIDGMVSSLGDVYTSYTGSEQTDEFDELVNGTYEGIGCTIQKDEDKLRVVSVFEDGPAEKAGLKAEDLILKVDDNIINAKTDVNKISDYIKKSAGEKVKLLITRDEEEKTITIKREMVESPVVSSKTFEENDKKIGYIDISIFSSVSTKQFKKELQKLEKEKIDGLIIDVRDNSGGYLTVVTDIASQLLEKGKVLYQIEKNKKIDVTKDKTGAHKEYPIVVLVNEYSASASEILAGAIKESYGGYVVGVKTYGKGTVQQVKKLSDGSMIKYTVENWLTPKGNWINENGIEPTHKVQMNDNYWTDPKEENDNQLEKALELVSK